MIIYILIFIVCAQQKQEGPVSPPMKTVQEIIQQAPYLTGRYEEKNKN